MMSKTTLLLFVACGVLSSVNATAWTQSGGGGGGGHTHGAGGECGKSGICCRDHSTINSVAHYLAAGPSSVLGRRIAEGGVRGVLLEGYSCEYSICSDGITGKLPDVSQLSTSSKQYTCL